MELVRRPLTDGTSTIDMYMQDGALVLLETDTGPTARAFAGGSDMEYYVSVHGEERLVGLLTRLGEQTGHDLVRLLDDDGLQHLASALVARFGDGLDLLAQFRAWMAENGITYEEYVR